MEDYRLEQSGQEVQNILNTSTPQSDLDAEILRAGQAEQALDGKIDAEETRAKAAEKQNADDIDAIEEKIPSGASSSNKFATESDVNGASQTLQGNIDAEALRAGQSEQTLDGKIDAEETRAKAAEKQNADDIDAIEEKIPSGASSANKLATENYVNDKVETNSATFRGTFNLVSDLGLVPTATHSQIAYSLGGEISTADNNDYAFVQIPTSVETPTEIAKIERYKFNGVAWAFEYDLNNSGFTAAQWAAINSGITSGLVTKLSNLPTNEQLTTLLNGKQDTLTFDNVPTQGSNNPVKSGGVYSYIKDEEERAKAAEKVNADDIDAIEEKIPSDATSSNKLATASDVTGEATIRENADAALQQAIEAILLLIPSAATSLNQLADKAFVNSSIATATATFRGTYNLVNDLGLMVSATHAQIATALAGAVVDEDNNDYAFVQVPTSDATPTQIAKTERYKFNGTAWEYEYDLNNSGYTADQWAAINSGITAALVSKLSALPTNAELTTALGLLSDGIASINGKIPSEATTSNKLVDTAAMQSYVAQIINAIDATFNVGSADGHVAVQITQVNGVITNVAITTSDIASASALTLVTGRVTDAEANIVSLGGRMTTAEDDIDDLQQLYNNLQQSAPHVIEPTDTWPVAVADRSATVIYRVVDRVNTPPQYYSDYMFRASDLSGKPVLMAQYDNAIDPRPKKGSQNLVSSGGVFDNIGALDVSELNATENPHTLATYADLSAALAAVPSDYQKGGMSIKFIQGSVGSSDNKYVQYRCMADEWSTDTDDWTIADEGVYVENPEFIYVKTDAEGKILWAIKIDGSIYYGAGVLQQVIDYIEEKLADLSLDEYEDIVAFLNDLEKGDKTLQTLLDEKVDKEESKSLIDAEYANDVHYIENPEFITAYLDSNRKILFGVKKDGNFVFGYGVPQQVRDYVEKEVTETIRMKVDKEEGKSLIPTQYIQETENSAFVDACTDNEDKLIEATTKEGVKVFFGDVDVKHDLTAKKISSNKIYLGEYELSPASTVVVNTIINDPEGRLEIKADKKQKIIAYRDENGVLHENVGVKTKEIKLSQTGLDILAKDLRVNWSGYISNDGENPLHLSMPKCARINLLTDFDLTKLSKKGYSMYSKEGVNYDIPIELEFWDMQGNYFKKKAFIGGQGDSTMAFDKKNIAIDLFDSEWDGDTFSIKFGDWVAQDSFHLKAYDYEPFVGAGAWSYKLFEQMMSVYSPEVDHIWKRALWDNAANTPTQASGSDLGESSEYNDTDARCFPDGFPVVVYQLNKFWGVFSMQLKKHRDNYHMSSSKPNHVFLDGKIGEGTLDANGSPNAIRWDLWEIRNPKNLVYAPFAEYGSETTYKEGDSVTDSSRSKIYRSLQDDNMGNPLTFPYWKDCGDYTYKYDADVVQAEIAGNHDGSTTYDNWSAGSYNIGDIVRHSGHLYMNIVANNSKEPVYGKKNNSDSSPDFKNKTKCGWLNVTNTIKVKENIFAFTTIMTKIGAKETAYLADPTAENLAAMKAEFETYFDVQNLIDYIIVTDVIRDDDAFWKNWLWTTYDGVKWWCNLYDCNISFGYGGAGTGGFYRHPAPFEWNGVQRHLCTYERLQTGRSEFMLRYIIDYYADELKQTWIELREGKIIDENNIYNIAKNWIDSIGLNAYELENNKWGYVKHIDNMMRIYKWISQSVLGLDQLYGYFDNLYADFTIYRSTDKDYTIRCIDMKVSHVLSRQYSYIQGYITRHETVVGGETVSTYSITGGVETDEDTTKTYTTVKDAIIAASSQPVDVPSSTLSYIKARCENIEYHRK